MKIETKRLYIIEFTLDMAEAVHKNSLDEDNRRFVPDEVFETVQDAYETIEYLMSQYDGGEGPFVYPVITKEGLNVGYVQLIEIKEGWEVGYHIAKEYTGNGYASEAVEAFLPVMAKEKGLDKVYGICLQENVASVKVMEKVGFTNLYTGMGKYQGKESAIVKNVWEYKG